MNKDLMIIIVDDELEALTHFLYQVVEEKNILEIKAIIKAGGTSEIIEECDYIIKNSENDCENKIIRVKECSITSIGICLD